MVSPWSDPPSTLGGREDPVAGPTIALVSTRVQLAERKFDITKVPPPPHPVLKLSGKIICTPKNITNIQALPKAGKSSVVSAILAATLNGNRQGADTLGFSAVNVDDWAVLHFDTEQSPYDHDAMARRAIRRGNVDVPPDWFKSYCLTDLDLYERFQCIVVAMQDAFVAHGGILMVIIDGVADICRDPNNAEESFDLVGKLHAAAIKYDCAIITVLHENPGSDSGKMRGHLGSQLERKAETPLRLQKDLSSGITTMWSDHARHGRIPKDQGTCFEWSDTLGMHVSCGTAGQIKASQKHEKYRDEAEAAFGDAAQLTYTELCDRIIESVPLKESAAKKRVATYQAEGITTKNQDGHYRLNPTPSV